MYRLYKNTQIYKRTHHPHYIEMRSSSSHSSSWNGQMYMRFWYSSSNLFIITYKVNLYIHRQTFIIIILLKSEYYCCIAPTHTHSYHIHYAYIILCKSSFFDTEEKKNINLKSIPIYPVCLIMHNFEAQ